MDKLWKEFQKNCGWKDRDGMWVIPENMLGSFDHYKKIFLATVKQQEFSVGSKSKSYQK